MRPVAQEAGLAVPTFAWEFFCCGRNSNIHAIDALMDIVERCFRLHRCCGIATALCLAVFVVSCIGLHLSGKGDQKIDVPDPPVSGITGGVSMFLLLRLCFLSWPVQMPSRCRQFTNDLNQHVRDHARNLCFPVSACCETAWRLMVSSEARADGSV